MFGKFQINNFLFDILSYLLFFKYEIFGTILFELNQPVLVYSPKTKQFSETGHIHSWIPSDDLLGPRSYTVRMASGALRRVNSSWLNPLPRAEN